METGESAPAYPLARMGIRLPGTAFNFSKRLKGNCSNLRGGYGALRS